MTLKEKLNDLFREDIWETVIIHSREDFVMFTNLLKDLDCTGDVYKDHNDLYVMNLRMKDSSYCKLLRELEGYGYGLADNSRTGFISRLTKIR